MTPTVEGRRAIDVDGDATATEVLAAIRDDSSRAGDIEIECPRPRPVHEHVGLVAPDRSVTLTRALAAAGRSRGIESPVAAELDRARERLSSLSVPDAGTERERRRVAEAADAEDRLEERAATLRGRVRALSDVGADTSEAEAELASVMRSLSEAQTERIAAEQALERARERALDARRARDRRLRLRDRVANLEREARLALVEQLRPEYATAVRDAPGPTPDDPFDADTVTALLAVGRLALLRAPVVLDCRRFADAAAAADWLDAPVIRL